MKPFTMRSTIPICALFAFTVTVSATEAPDFNREVRPILAANCYEAYTAAA